MRGIWGTGWRGQLLHAPLFSILIASQAYGSVAAILCHLTEMAQPHSSPLKVNTEDRQYLGQFYDAQVAHLERQDSSTEVSIVHLLSQGRPVYQPYLMTGPSFAGTQYLLNFNGVRRGDFLVISAQPADKISPVFSGNPVRGTAKKTGGGDTIGATQDFFLFGELTRTPSNEIRGDSFGEGQRGNNEGNGTTLVAHLAGVGDMPMLFNTREVGNEYRDLMSADQLAGWPPDANIKTVVQKTTDLSKLAAGLIRSGGTLEEAGRQIEALKQKKIKFYDSASKSYKDIPLLSQDAKGNWVLTFAVYSSSAVKAIGLTSFNVVVGPANHPFREFANQQYQHTAEQAANTGGRVATRPRVGMAEQNIHLSYDEIPPANSVFVELGPGDSAFINLQKRVGDVQGKRDDMGTHILMGRSCSMQSGNVRLLFDPAGPYYGKVKILNTPDIGKDAPGVTDVRLVTVGATGHRTEVPFIGKDGKPLPIGSVPGNAVLETRVKGHKAISNLNDVAAFFKSAEIQSARDLIAKGFLPNSMIKANFLKPFGKDMIPDQALIDAELARNGGNVEALMTGNSTKELIENMFFNPADPHFVATMNAAGKMVRMEGIGDDAVMVITSDFIDISQSYNNDAYLNGVMAHQGEARPLFREVNASARKLPFLRHDAEDVKVATKVTSFKMPDGTVVKLEHGSVTFLGAANGTVGPGNLEPNATRGAVADAILNYFANVIIQNKSPFGLQSHMQAIRAGAEVFKGLLVDSAKGRRELGPRRTTTLSQERDFRQFLANKDHHVTVEREPANFPVDLVEMPTGFNSLEVPVTKEKVHLENDLYHELFSKFFATDGLGGPDSARIKLRFRINEQGRLEIISQGALVNGQSFATALRSQLVKNPRLANDLGNLVRMLGGEADIALDTRKTGLVMADSVRFNTPVQHLATTIREVTRKAGSKSLADPKIVAAILGSMENLPLTSFRPDHPNSLQSIAAVTRVANSGGVGAHLSLMSEKPGGNPGSFMAPGGQERIYLLGEGGKAKGAAIISQGDENLSRAFRYVAGEQRMRDAGLETNRILNVFKLPPKNDGLEHGVAIIVKVSDGTAYSELKEEKDRQAAAASVGNALARFQTVSGAKETERREEREADFSQKQLALLKNKPTPFVLHMLADPFFHGPTHGGLLHDKIYLTKNGDGKFTPTFTNFYESRGWGNVLFDIATFTREMKTHEELDSFLHAYVSTRMREADGTIAEAHLVQPRVDLIKRFLTDIESGP